MGHALLLTVFLAYKAFLGDLMIGFVPQTADLESLNSLYKVEEVDDEDISPYIISKDIQYISPVIDSKSAIAVDLGTDKVLYSKDVYKKKQIASITKLMTAILVTEKLKLDDIIEITPDATAVIGSRLSLGRGEKFTVESLLYAMLVHSANDAAYALSVQASGSEDTFVSEMNQKAKQLGLVNTSFGNSVGFDSSQNYSTAFEVYLLTKEFLKNPLLKEIVNTKEIKIKNLSGKEYDVKSTNKNLDSFLKVRGVKTGTTDMAGQSLVNLIENDKGKDIVVVLLDSPRRFEEAKILGEWCFRAYVWDQKKDIATTIKKD